MLASRLAHPGWLARQYESTHVRPVKSITKGAALALGTVSHPSRSGCTYTMPQRLTVAGEATARSWTSNIMFIRPCTHWRQAPVVA